MTIVNGSASSEAGAATAGTKATMMHQQYESAFAEATSSSTQNGGGHHEGFFTSAVSVQHKVSTWS